MELTWNPPIIEPQTATYSWGNDRVDYATEVYFGREFVDGHSSPGRDWTTPAIERVDLPQQFKQNHNGNIEEAFVLTAIELGEEFKDVIDNHNFGYPSRNNKRYRAGLTFREITDSGDLRNSQQLEIS